ncbi:MAG: right-handed parallel beta-helix repeat-containing protein, partial [Armatimonadota bacterium]
MRHYRALLVTTVLLVISPVLAFAATINVPSGQTTIQAAINAAVTGDVVVVAAGTYAENLDFKGKAITVRSTNPLSPAVVGATILDGANKGSVVTFQTGETTASLLSGFTITRGSGALDVHGILSGGGVYCYYASPSLTYNVIRDNQAGQGGGLYCAYSFPTVSLCTFRGNQSTAPFRGGGAMGLWHSSPTLSGLTINSNTADHFGGGVLCETNSSPLFTGSTLSNNTAGAGGGGLCCNDHSSPIVSGLTFTGNKANTTTYGPGDGGGVFCTG